jgi:hypothetical protein
MADRSNTIVGWNADDDISSADIVNLSPKVRIHYRFLPNGHWE